MAKARTLGGSGDARRSRSMAVLGGAVVAAVAVIGLGLAWWLGYFEEPPAEASLQDSVAAAQQADSEVGQGAADQGQVDEGQVAEGQVDGGAADGGQVGTDDGVNDDGISGTWTVRADPATTFVGYRINEVLTTIGDFEVVGRTGEVSGTVEIDGSSIVATELVVDMASLTTDNGRRDAAMREQALETDEYPTASFVLTEPIDLGEPPGEGVSVSLPALGELTIHGVTQAVTFPLEAQRVGDLIVVVGQLDIALADYEIATPQAPIVASVEDRAVLELSVALERVG